MDTTKPILAFETAFDAVSLCLYDGKVLDFTVEAARRKQTERVLPMLDALLKKHGLALTDMGALAFNRGPGSFSGIRINTAVVQALAWAHDLPCIGVSSLAATAQAAFELRRELNAVNVAIDARMSEVYFALVTKGANGLARVEDAERLLAYTYDFTSINAKYVAEDATKQAALAVCEQAWVGDGVCQLTHLPADAIVIELNDVSQMSAKQIAKLAWQDYEDCKTVGAADAQPVYLRNNAWKTLAEQGK